MQHLIRAIAGALLLAIAVCSADSRPEQPWEKSAVGMESGILWQVGDNTSLSYRIVPTQLSWRSGEVLGWGFGDGSRLVARHRFALLGHWVQQGPESYYVAVNGSPSVEWWDSGGTWSLFAGAGGGFGLTDSRGVGGGQGQDFTFHWFARGGIERSISATVSLSAGITFLHISNLGLTDPNPGIDALGFTFGYARRF